VPQGLQAYFQTIRPIVKCDAEDGRVVGQLLLDHLVNTKPKDPARAIREFVNRMAMLRECGFGHIGAMLVAMLVVNTLSNSERGRSAAVQLAAQGPASVTVAQAIALGGMLAASARSAHLRPCTKL
jgi:hypothetical protein